MQPLDRDEEIANLLAALKSRDVIGMAKGILMERHGLTPDEAFVRLVAMSQRANVKLREVAKYLVDLRMDVATQRPEIDFTVD